MPSAHFERLGEEGSAHDRCPLPVQDAEARFDDNSHSISLLVLSIRFQDEIRSANRLSIYPAGTTLVKLHLTLAGTYTQGQLNVWLWHWTNDRILAIAMICVICAQLAIGSFRGCMQTLRKHVRARKPCQIS